MRTMTIPELYNLLCSEDFTVMYVNLVVMC